MKKFTMKKLPLFLLSLVVAIATWAPASFAQRQAVNSNQFLSTSPNGGGVANGADLTGAVTLTVGNVVGGAETDVFTNNSATPNNGALAISTGASSQGNVVFNTASTVFGNIGVTDPGGPFLLSVQTAAGNTGTVNFLGQVFNTTYNINGTGTVNFLSGSRNSGAVIFGANGTIGLGTNTTLVGAVTTTAGTNTGNLVLGSGSFLNGAVGAAAASLNSITVTGGTSTTGVTASTSGAVFAYTFNLGTNTLNVGGQLTLADSTTTGVIATTLASPTVFGHIVVSGATTYGTALAVNVTVPHASLILVGNQFNIISQTGAGTPGTVIKLPIQDPLNPLYTFSQVPATGGTVNGLVAIVVTGIPLGAPFGTPNPVLPALLAIAPGLNPNSTLFQAAAAINALTDPVAIANAEAQLAPSAPDLGAALVAFQGTREFEGLWQSRIDDVTCGEVGQRMPDGQPPVCKKDDPHDGWWTKGFAYLGSQGTRNGFTGYDSRIVGTMIAYDTPIFRDQALGIETRVGAGIGYAQSHIDGTPIGTGNSNADFNTYEATAYISHEQGPWFVQGDVAFGWNDYSGQRNISFPGFSQTANASYSGQEYTAFATSGYHFLVPQGITITPLASLQYTHVDLGSYNETGAGDVDLKVKSQSYDFLESGLGVKVARPFAASLFSTDGGYVPEVHFKWLRELLNPTLKNTAAFSAPGSPYFTTAGFNTSDDTFDVGAGLQFLSCSCSAKTWALEAVYDYEWRRDNYSANQGMIKFSARF
jgi:uncharacterized protein with beta-barrel porin domain